jgi:hypothetical protein
MKLVIKVSATALYNNGEVAPEAFAGLHGVASDECFSEYIIDSAYDGLKRIAIEGGTLTIEYDAEFHRLWSIISYTVPRRLNEQEEAALVDYTIGQLLDGIGDNLAQEHDRKTGIFLIPAHNSDELSLAYV